MYTGYRMGAGEDKGEGGVRREECEGTCGSGSECGCGKRPPVSHEERSDASHEVCAAKPDRMRNAQPFRIA